MKRKQDVVQGTLALMVLKTLDVLGALRGFGIARRIEQISRNLEAGARRRDRIRVGTSENNRRPRFYRLTREGRKQLQMETQDREQTAAIVGRFFAVKTEDLS